MRPSAAVSDRFPGRRSRWLPPLLFGLRTATSGMLALYVAFRLQLDDPSWAATSAVIVAQPVLGASLRKGSFRLIGTLAGAVFSVLLYAAFPQDRVGLLIGLALWGGICSFVSTFLREFAAYAAMLAGYTAAIIAMDAVSAPGDVFLLAVARGSAIAIGIICTTLVFSLTDLGRQRQILAGELDSLAAQSLDGLRGVLGADPEPMDRQRDRRRALVARVAALDTVVDQAVGESYDLRARVGVLRAALTGLFVGLSCWRGLEQHVRRLPEPQRKSLDDLRRLLDRRLPGAGTPAQWRQAGRELLATPDAGVSQRLLLDRLGYALLALARVHDEIVLLRDPLHSAPGDLQRSIQVSDPLAAAVNALRAVLVVGAAELAWVLSGWSSGPVFVTFAMVVVMLYVLRDETAFSGAAIMAGGCALALLAACILKFAMLPLAQAAGLDGFGAFSVIVGGMILGFAAAAAALRQGTTVAAVAFATMANFMPLFSPTNAQTYDYAGFLNTAIAIMAGASMGAAGYRWLPPLSPGLRARRLIAGTRRDLRRLVAGWRLDEQAWARRLHLRLVQLPKQATLQEHAQVLAALSVGTELLRCRALRDAAGVSASEAIRRDAARREIAEAVASHPRFFAGMDL